MAADWAPGPVRASHSNKAVQPCLWQVYCTHQGKGGGGFYIQETVNLLILARQNPRHFLKISEQITEGRQKLLMRNSGPLLLFPGGLWMVAAMS